MVRKMYKLTKIMWIDAIILWFEYHNERAGRRAKMKADKRFRKSMKKIMKKKLDTIPQSTIMRAMKKKNL